MTFLFLMRFTEQAALPDYDCCMTQNAIEGADNVDLDIPWESPGLPRLDHDLKLLQVGSLGLTTAIPI